MCLHSSVLEEVPGPSMGGGFSVGTWVSVHMNKERCVSGAEETGIARAGVPPSLCMQAKHRRLPSLSAAPLATESADCPLCAAVSGVSYQVNSSPSKMQPSDVYCHLGPAIKMMNELTAKPCERALQGEINT